MQNLLEKYLAPGYGYSSTIKLAKTYLKNVIKDKKNNETEIRTWFSDKEYAYHVENLD